MVDGGCRLCILEPSSRGIGWPGMNPDPKRRRVDALCQIAVGTDCSGLETPMMALRQVLDEDLVDISHVFASEIFEPARQQLQVNSRPGILYGDVTTRNHALAPPCDLYFAGFPCQPFSRAGRGKGFSDGRGGVFFSITGYLEAQAPRGFILENVEGLLSNDSGRTMATVLQTLSRLRGRQYEVEWRLLNSADHGVPQNRPRVYIVGRLRSRISSDRPFLWPEPISCSNLNLFLDPIREPNPEDEPDIVTQSSAARALWFHRARLQRMPPPADEEVVIDIDSSLEYSNVMVGRSPCMTRSRDQGFWLYRRGRRMNLQEQLRLQGMNAGMEVVVSKKAMSQMVGNAMSQNILERILTRLLPSLNLVPADMVLRDRYAESSSLSSRATG